MFKDLLSGDCFSVIELLPGQDVWETAEAYYEAAQALLPDKHIRIGVTNGKIACRATPYNCNSWEKPYRERLKAGGSLS